MRKGFTLVEVLVALAVLSVGLLAVAAMSISFVRANTHTHAMSEAVVLAAAKMEQLRSYATSERADTFSPFDFDYLTSTDPALTTVIDPPGSANQVTVSGLLSGTAGTPVVLTGGNNYEVLYDDGTNGGDETAGDGIYTGSDVVDYSGTGAGFTVSRRWMVEPLPIDVNGDGRGDFARLRTEASWVDRSGGTRTVGMESLVFRRQ
ncbi:MAG: prepilin-type N-terminal cleavage/methylation domain-containing protein [Thermodesulfobacteriota bacterium]|jgi:prepilin-type N-terminal cleavage/methylation domain-containing protein